MKPAELLQELSKDELYRQWIAHHSPAYLSHFFCPIDADYHEKAQWEIGFYDPAAKKITVFVPRPGTVEIKPADDVFQKEPAAIERLEVEKVTIDLEQAIPLCQQALQDYFPNEPLVEGFLILQTFQDTILWNFTFMAKTFRFVNVKIDAQTGSVVTHQQVDLVEK